MPLRTPFRIATRTVEAATNVIVTVRDADGSVGLGSSAPVTYVTGETHDSVKQDVAVAASALMGVASSDLSGLMTRLAEALPNAPSARAGLEMAVYDLWARTQGVSLWRHFGGRIEIVTTDLTIAFGPLDEARDRVLSAVADGFTAFKIKAGDPDGVEADLARLRMVAEAAPTAVLRIDANQAFAAAAAIAFANHALEITERIELLEQPVPKEDIAALKYVRNRVPLPVFADEAAQSPESVRRLIAADAVTGVNIKLMKSGIVGALEIISLCRQARLPLMIGCMLESRLGLTAAASIAAATGAIAYVDLDAHLLLAPHSGIAGGFVEHGPAMRIDPASSGWGCALA